MIRAGLIIVAVVALVTVAANAVRGTSSAFTDSHTTMLSVTSGGMAIKRDGDGLVFSSAALAPGDDATASVKVRNGGTLPADLTLTRETLGSTSPGGCAVRDALTLKIVEVGAGDARRTLTDGPLAAAPTEIALGTFAVGDARAYEFTVTFVAGHGATATDNDNCFQGSVDSERFGWDATEKAA